MAQDMRANLPGHSNPSEVPGQPKPQPQPPGAPPSPRACRAAANRPCAAGPSSPGRAARHHPFGEGGGGVVRYFTFLCFLEL